MTSSFFLQILPGNSNTYAVANNTLNPAIFASKIRLIPYSDHPRTVCMRIELVGCVFEGNTTIQSLMQCAYSLNLININLVYNLVLLNLFKLGCGRMIIFLQLTSTMLCFMSLRSDYILIRVVIQSSL